MSINIAGITIHCDVTCEACGHAFSAEKTIKHTTGGGFLSANPADIVRDRAQRVTELLILLSLNPEIDDKESPPRLFLV